MKRIFLVVVIVLFSQNTYAKKSTSTASVRKQVWNLIYNEDFEKAKKLIDAELLNKPDNLKLLSLYEISLNGMNRTLEANRTRSQILSIWKKKYKEKFIEEEYPLNLSSYVRVVEVKPGSLLLASEYYIPYPINKENDGYYYHKFTIYNRITKVPVKFFKLEKSKFTKDEFKLFKIDPDGKTEEMKNYGSEIPEIQDEVEFILKKTNL